MRREFDGVLVPTCAHRGALKDDTVVDEADVLGGLGGAGTLAPQQVQDTGSEDRVFAVFYELTKVSKTDFLCLWVLLDDADDRVNDGFLVLKAALCHKHTVKTPSQNRSLR